MRGFCAKATLALHQRGVRVQGVRVRDAAHPTTTEVRR